MKIFSYPSPNDGNNPYLKMFYESLLPYNIEWGGSIVFSKGWLLENKNNIDLLHIHWPELIWNVRYLNKSITGPFSAWKIAGLKRFLEEAKRLKKPLILTLHNLGPHENAKKQDIEGFSMVCRMADIIISHSQWAAEKAVELLNIDPKKIIIMYHGTYQGEYPPPRTREDICREIGLDVTKPIIGCVGLIRKYKGFETVVNAVELLKEAQLLIAGKPSYAPAIFSKFKEDIFADARKNMGKRLVTVLHELTRQEFVDMITVCDVIVIPYKEVTGSGILLAALSFGKPVVVSDLPFFHEILASEPKAFKTAKPGNVDSFLLAIEQILGVDLQEASRAAKRLAECYQWKDVIKPVVEKLRLVDLT